LTNPGTQQHSQLAVVTLFTCNYEQSEYVRCHCSLTGSVLHKLTMPLAEVVDLLAAANSPGDVIHARTPAVVLQVVLPPIVEGFPELQGLAISSRSCSTFAAAW
jgi:hypothetical protein